MVSPRNSQLDQGSRQPAVVRAAMNTKPFGLNGAADARFYPVRQGIWGRVARMMVRQAVSKAGGHRPGQKVASRRGSDIFR